MATDSITQAEQARGEERTPDFNNMNRAELSIWCVEKIGYDLAVENPEISLSLYRTICTGLHRLRNQRNAIPTYMAQSDYLAICSQLNSARELRDTNNHANP